MRAGTGPLSGGGATGPALHSVSGMDTPSGWDADTLADALDVLAEVPAWKLSPQRWDQVLAVLDRMAAAFRGGDAQELRDAVADLELSGPTRIQRVGTKETTGTPDQVVGRLGALVHSLGTQQRTASATKDAHGADRR